ncbi:MAG TPA: hypothetical protein VHB97_12615 [Polyangia bacterium]|nr:hypothetical protein [Polyangia bacterium]
MGPRFDRMLLGLVQLVAGIVVAVVWRMGHPVIVEHMGAENDLGQLMVHGFAHYFYFLFLTLWGWLALWLFAEGLIRVAAGAAGQRFATTAPLASYRALDGWLRPPPPPPPDILRREGATLVIDSARDYAWDALSTIDVDGALYTVEYEPPQPIRAFRYRLTPIASNHVIRVVTRYASSATGENSDASKP